MCIAVAGATVVLFRNKQNGVINKASEKVPTAVTVTPPTTNIQTAKETAPSGSSPVYTVGQLTHLVGEVPDGTDLTISGTVEQGSDKYCPDDFYLKDNTGYIWLSDQKKAGEFLGKQVEISGTYQWTICEALCICGPQLSITEIK